MARLTSCNKSVETTEHNYHSAQLSFTIVFLTEHFRCAITREAFYLARWANLLDGLYILQI